MARGLLSGEDALKDPSNATAKRALDEVDVTHAGFSPSLELGFLRCG
jgi:hypothetical protein